MKNGLCAFALIFAFALLAGCAQGGVQTNKTGGQQPPAQAEPNYTAALFPQPGQQNLDIVSRELGEAANMKQRPKYANLSDSVFARLPQFPEDLFLTAKKIERGMFSDLRSLNESYYKQPEFYPTFEFNLPRMQNPPQTGITAFGFGTYPSEIHATTVPGDEFGVVTFFYTSWLVRTFQGMSMQPVFPDEAALLLPEGMAIKQDAKKARGYFIVSFDPPAFQLGPSWPEFDNIWAQKVEVKVRVNPNTPKGVYVIGVNPGSPPPELSEQWAAGHRGGYTEGGLMTGVGRPFFQLVVQVQ